MSKVDPRWSQDGPSCFQGGPRWPHDGRKTAPRWPQGAPPSSRHMCWQVLIHFLTCGPRRRQDGPRLFKLTPRWPMMAPGCTKMGQGGPKLFTRGDHAPYATHHASPHDLVLPKRPIRQVCFLSGECVCVYIVSRCFVNWSAGSFPWEIISFTSERSGVSFSCNMLRFVSKATLRVIAPTH